LDSGQKKQLIGCEKTARNRVFLSCNVYFIIDRRIKMLHFYPPIFLRIEKSFKENVNTEDTEGKGQVGVLWIF
jgi:hypothetical protein